MTATAAEARPLYRIIRMRELTNFVGLKRTQIEDLISKDQFPKAIPLSDSGRAKGWIEDEIIQWQRERLAKRDAAAKKNK